MTLSDNGYLVHALNIDGRRLVDEARALLRDRCGDLTSFHERNDGDIIDLQNELSGMLLSSDLIHRIIKGDLAYFRALIGADLHIQKFPYLRIARPGKAQDNIGIHRDTWYGSSPYEMSVSIALTDTDEAGALRFVPGSHANPDSAYEIEEMTSQHQKGSTGHKLGFLYAPKRIRGLIGDVPVPLCVGECVIFGSAIAHGQEVNRSERTRVSVDVRLVNSLAPIKWDRSVHADYYHPLATSPATEQARMYLDAA